MGKSAIPAQRKPAGMVLKRLAQAPARHTKKDLKVPHPNEFSEENCETPGYGYATTHVLDSGKEVTIYKSDRKEYQSLIDSKDCPDIFCFANSKLRIYIIRYQL